MTRLPHVLALTGAGLILASCKPPGAAPAPTMAAAATVTVAIPVQKRIMEWDEFVGRLSSPKTVQLRARVSGYLEKIHFKEGGEVKENDILFTIDPRPYQAIVDRAQAELERTKTQAELAASEA